MVSKNVVCGKFNLFLPNIIDIGYTNRKSNVSGQHTTLEGSNVRSTKKMMVDATPEGNVIKLRE